MFLREVTRQNKNGTQASYLQLVHNQWDPTARASRTKILYSFGRTDQVERAAIQRLITSLSRLLDPATAFRVAASSELTFLEARPLESRGVADIEGADLRHRRATGGRPQLPGWTSRRAAQIQGNGTGGVMTQPVTMRIFSDYV